MIDFYEYERKFATLLRTKRKSIGKTKTDLCVSIGVSKDAIKSWENIKDTQLPSLHRIAKIAEAYEIEFEMLRELMEKAQEQRAIRNQLGTNVKRKNNTKRQVFATPLPGVYR